MSEAAPPQKFQNVTFRRKKTCDTQKNVEIAIYDIFKTFLN